MLLVAECGDWRAARRRARSRRGRRRHRRRWRSQGRTVREWAGIAGAEQDDQRARCKDLHGAPPSWSPRRLNSGKDTRARATCVDCAPSQALNSSTRAVPSSPIMRVRIARRVPSDCSRRMRRCHGSVRIAGSSWLSCNASSSSHSPPSSQASSQVEHTSTRFATVPVSLYFAITRAHFGQTSAPMLSEVATGPAGRRGVSARGELLRFRPVPVVQQRDEAAVAGVAAHGRQVFLDQRGLQVGGLAAGALHRGLLHVPENQYSGGRALRG